MFDLVFYTNEKEKKKFEEQGKNFGFSKVYFIKEDVNLLKVKDRQDFFKQISKASHLKKPIFIIGGDDEINRAAVESSKIKALISPEIERKKDFTHYRNSGLNQVLCKLASKNKVAIGINFNDFQGEKKDSAQKLGRVMQNIKLCSKYKTKMFIASFARKPIDMVLASDLKSFCTSIRMDTKMTKEALLVLNSLL